MQMYLTANIKQYKTIFKQHYVTSVNI